MSISCNISILWAKGREKRKQLFSYAHYCNPTRSFKENKKRKQDAIKAANAERMATLERALKKASKTRTVPEKAAPSTSITTGSVHFTCCRFSGFG